MVLLWALLPLCLEARESVCLRSGFCLEAESHMISDGMLILQSGKGTLQFPVDQVEEIRAITAAPEAKKAVEAKVVNTSSNAVAGSEELLLRAAIQEGLEPDFVRSVAMVESGLRQESLSPKGAVGLMQLMPFTAGQLGVNASIAEQNALGGATFLRQLLIKYNGDSALALAAYNAGPGAVDKYKGVPPYMETRKYVVRVLQEYAKQQRLQVQKNTQTLKAAAPNEHSGVAMAQTLSAQPAGNTAAGVQR